MALGRYNIGSLSHRPDGSRAVSPSLPTGGSSSLDLRSPDPTPGTQKWDPDQTWDPMPLPLTLNLKPFLPCLSLAHAHMTYQSNASRKKSVSLSKLFANAGTLWTGGSRQCQCLTFQLIQLGLFRPPRNTARPLRAHLQGQCTRHRHRNQPHQPHHHTR